MWGRWPAWHVGAVVSRDQTRLAGVSTSFGHQVRSLRWPPSVAINFAAIHWTIDVGGVDYDALDLATQAVDAWDVWLTGHGLLPLPT